MGIEVEFEEQLHIAGEALTIRQERVSTGAYIDFLKRCDLGSQYPREDFVNRIGTLLKNIQISLIVRNSASEIIGICFGLTDFAYWLLVTDLGVDRRYERRGLGRILMERAHDLAGGEQRIIQFAYANENAIPFYERIGMCASRDMMEKVNIDWTGFEVGEDF